MKDSPAVPRTIDEYIEQCSPEVQKLLQKIRRTIRGAAPRAEEVISYRMPAFKQDGILVYFAAFKNHIGLYPPVKGNESLVREVSPYAGEKGNLKFPLDQPIPDDLIKRIVLHRLEQNQALAAAKRNKPKKPK